VKQAERVPTAAPQGDGGRSAQQPARSPDQANFDELAFLHSVVEPKPSPPSPGPPLRSSGAQPVARPLPPPAAATASAPPRPRTPMGSASPPGQPASAPVAAAKPPPLPPPPIARPAVTPPDAVLTVPMETGQESTGRGTMDTGSVPVFLRDVPSEQIKTLKCAECGTMNYPTEWYCERCGGELAAM
jgi:hypothetical protein